MNKILNIIGWIMIILFAIGTVFYWSAVYPNGIGFFGAILTLPMAMILAFIITTLTSLSSALVNIIWAVTAFWLITRGIE